MTTPVTVTVSPLNQALLEMLKTFQQGKDFVIEQAPDVVQQLITYSIIKESLWVAASLAVAGAGFALWRKAGKLYEIHKNSYSDCYVPCWIFGGIFMCLGVGNLFDDGFDLLKLIIAPKVWLMEYAASVVRYLS